MPRIWYFATPYTDYRYGTHLAHVHACREAALFHGTGIRVFCPIAHSHPITVYGGLDPADHDAWMAEDEPFIAAAAGLIVCMLAGWDTSRGVAREMNAFREDGKPVVFMTPGTAPLAEIRGLAP